MICVRLILSVLLCVLTSANPLTSNKLNWRIIGGSEAKPGAYPFIISLRSENSHICGGSILGGVWVLTTANCVSGSNPSQLTVIVGTNQLDSGGVPYSVKRTIVHEDYDSHNILDNIALIELTTPIIENNLVKRIKLDTKDNNKQRAVTLIGWGFTLFPGSSLPNNLQYLQLQTIPIKNCREAWPDYTITDKQVCTKGESGKGACQGDSGGPLINNAGHLIGLVSYGIPCAKGVPDIYTKVAPYVSWIHKETNIK